MDTSLEFYLMLALIVVYASHLFPRLWLFLCRVGGGVGRWDTTEVSGQVGLRLYFTENDSSDGPDVQTNTNLLRKLNWVHFTKYIIIFHKNIWESMINRLRTIGSLIALFQ